MLLGLYHLLLAIQQNVPVESLLQMPLAAVRIGQASAGNSLTLLLEFCPHVSYTKLRLIMNAMIQGSRHEGRKGLDKAQVRMLLAMAQSDRERECLRYAVFKSSGMSATQVRRQYGFENMNARAHNVEECIKQAQDIRVAVEELAEVQDKALLASVGIADRESDDSAGEDESVPDAISSSDMSESECDGDVTNPHFSNAWIKATLKQSRYNWFEFCERAQEHTGKPLLELEPSLDKIFQRASDLGLTDVEYSLTSQSKRAYSATKLPSSEEDRIARSVNGEIVTDSDSDNPEEYLGLSDLLTERGKQLIAKRRAAIRRKMERVRVKAVAKERFLSRKVSHRTSRVLKDCPDIGKSIEALCKVEI